MSLNRHSKTKERLILAQRIASTGIEMPPCSYCSLNGETCVVAKGKSARCSECTRRGRKCDVEGPSLSD